MLKTGDEILDWYLGLKAGIARAQALAGSGP